MTDQNTVKLINLLIPDASDSCKQKLLDLYRDAFFDTDSFRTLSSLLNDCDFLGQVGEQLYQDGKTAISDGAAGIDSFGFMDQTAHTIRSEAARTQAFFETARMDDAKLSVISHDISEDVMSFYRALLSACCFVVASLYGPELLNNIKIPQQANPLAVIKIYSAEITSLLADIGKERRPAKWRIERASFHGKNLVRYNGLKIVYEDRDEQQITEECDKVSPFLFVPKQTGATVCYGTGLITNMNPKNALSVFGSKVIREPARNCLDQENIDYSNFDILSCLNKVLGSGVYFIEPHKLVELFNRYFMMKTVRNRIGQNACPYTGGSKTAFFEIPEDFKVPEPKPATDA